MSDSGKSEGQKSAKKLVLKIRNSPTRSKIIKISDGSSRKSSVSRESLEKDKNNGPPTKLSFFPFRRKKKANVDQNLEPNVIEQKEKKLEDSRVTKFRQDITQEFIYPSYGKHVAWVLTFIVIIGSTAFTSYKGMSVDTVIGTLWLGVSILTLVLLFVVLQPIILGLYAIVIKYIYDFHREIYYKNIPDNLFENPEDENKAIEAKEFRLNNITSYIPTPKPINQEKRLEIFYAKERRYLLRDITATAIILLALLLIVFSDHSDYAIFSRRTVINLANDGKFTKSIALNNVSSYEQFQEYLGKTLIPALLTNSSNSTQPEPPENSTDGYFMTELQFRGWTRDSQVKLIGQPRILQKRVQMRSCEGKTSRQDSCQSELNPFNHDSSDYGAGWEPLLLGEDQLNHTELDPWFYKPWSEVQGAPWFGRLASCFAYGQGGYVIFLGKGHDNAEMVYNFMNYFHWIDYRTRAIFIDFITYAPGADLFNVATIVFEVSASGLFIPSFRINSGKLLNKEPIYYAIVFGKLAILITCIGYLILSESWKCWRVGKTEYFKSGWAILNVHQAAIGIISVITTSLAIIYASMLDDKLDSAGEDQFVNFQLTCFWERARTYSNAFLISIEVIKIIRYLRYLGPYHQFLLTFGKSIPYLLALSFFILLTCLSFSILFNQFIGTVEERFSSISGSLTSMFGHTIGVHDTLGPSFLRHDLPILNGILLLVFLLIICYFVFGMMKVILAVNLESVYQEPVQTKNCLKKPSLRRDDLPPVREKSAFKGLYINVLRFQHMKRIVLETLTNQNHLHDTALSVVALVLSGRAQEERSKKFHTVKDIESLNAGTIDEDREKEMKELVEKILGKSKCRTR